MRHPAQGIRHMTSVAKQFVESYCIRSTSFFFWLYFFRVFLVNVFSAQPALQRAAPHSWASSPQRLFPVSAAPDSAGAFHQEQFS